jgi:hypothetical protein
MASYEKPTNVNLIYNDNDYKDLEDEVTPSTDLTAYILKTGDIMTGPISTTDLAIYNSGNIEFQTESGNKILNSDHITDIENNKKSVTNITYANDITTIGNVIVEKLSFVNGDNSQITAFTGDHNDDIEASTNKLTQVEYNNNLLKTTINNTCHIKTLTCDNINTTHLASTTANVQLQINDKQDIINDENRLNMNLINNGNISNANIEHLFNIQENIQTALNLLKSNKQDELKLTNRLNMNYVGTGYVSNNEVHCLDNIKSNIQETLDVLQRQKIFLMYEINNSIYIGLNTSDMGNGAFADEHYFSSSYFHNYFNTGNSTSEVVVDPPAPFFSSNGRFQYTGRYLIIVDYKLGYLHSLTDFRTKIQLKDEVNNEWAQTSKSNGQIYYNNKASLAYLYSGLSFFVNIDEVNKYSLDFHTRYDFEGSGSYNTGVKVTIQIIEL